MKLKKWERKTREKKSIEKYKILKTPLAKITDKSLTFSNRAQKRIFHGLNSRIIVI